MTPDIEAPEQLLRYLRDAQRIGMQETPRITALHGGVSNRAVLVEREDGVAWVLKQSLPQLRVEVEWFSDVERIQREAAGLRWLSRMLPESVPDFIFEDRENHLFAMRAVPQPHVNWKEHLLAGGLEQGHAADFASLLARIHRLGNENLEEVSVTFANRSSL
ncbi:MAG: phosphotransferase, partial [Anaerolineaceae bacterium]|nr:phosphotransferase [Anaerolineaceae bacterium]